MVGKRRIRNYNIRNMPMTTWLSASQVQRFRAIATAHGVSVATFLRSIVLDALDDEVQGFSLYLSPDGEAHYYPHLRLKSPPPPTSCVSKTS